MYEGDAVSYNVSDFILNYSGRFPLLAVVTQGFLGESEVDTFGTGQVRNVFITQLCTFRKPF